MAELSLQLSSLADDFSVWHDVWLDGDVFELEPFSQALLSAISLKTQRKQHCNKLSRLWTQYISFDVQHVACRDHLGKCSSHSW